MKQKRKKALDGIAVVCWGVGVIMIAVFLGMTAAYATCSGTMCDVNLPSCGTTVYYKPEGFSVAGCFKKYTTYWGTPELGLCKSTGEWCNTCLCRPKTMTIEAPCECL